jgi:hypothetical protein
VGREEDVRQMKKKKRDNWSALFLKQRMERKEEDKAVDHDAAS